MELLDNEERRQGSQATGVNNDDEERRQPQTVPSLTLLPASDGHDVNGSLPRLLTSRSAAALGLLTSDLIMARLGVYEPMSTKELILRNEDLVGVHDECAQSLMSLEILSLSHNKLTTLDGFQHFSNLIELNLNFNQITSLQNLQCAGLEKLFLSNNRIVDISSLKVFTKLNTLSVYGNLIADLETSLSTCRALPKLRALDLGGNPCSHEMDGYKFQVVRYLPRLKTLDGDQVTQLDKDLAEEYVIQGRPLTAEPSSRPSTATSMGSRPLTAAAKPWETGAPPQTPSKPFDAFASKHMPKGNVRLFRDDFLNNNPILLEYLAQGEDAHEQQLQQQQQQEQQDQQDQQLQLTSSFVEKMRNANPLVDTESHQSSEGEGKQKEEDDDGGFVTRPATAQQSRPSTAAAASGMLATSNLGVDPSDPKTTIRKLLKHIEVLEESLANYTTRQVEACEQALLEENRQLQIENNNIPILQEQVTMLKKKLSMETNVNGLCPPVPLTMAASSSGVVDREKSKSKVAELEKENGQLRREVARLRQMLKRHEIAASEPVAATTTTTDDPLVTTTMTMDHKPVRLSDTQLLDDSASLDVELTELILQNEVSLEMIRNDIKNTKKEWEEQFQVAKEKEKERQRVRPQTSLGLAPPRGMDLSTQRNERTISESVPKAASKQQGKADTQRRSRQLHTSAGFRHGVGPEERLLHPPSATTNGNGRSVTNILTL